MAEAFGKMYASDKANFYSSGSRPAGKINPKAIEAMKEIGYDLTKHTSKSLIEIPGITYDHVITMGCGDECPYIKANKRDEWNIPDPKNMEKEEFYKVRDYIKDKVQKLISAL